MDNDFSFEDTTPAETTSFIFADRDNAADINKGLKSLLYCANLFFTARESETIEFRVGVTESMLEMMGILLIRAAHCSSEQRTEVFQRWIEQGPQQCNALIEKVAEREVKILAPDDLAMFLRCPRGF